MIKTNFLTYNIILLAFVTCSVLQTGSHGWFAIWQTSSLSACVLWDSTTARSEWERWLLVGKGGYYLTKSHLSKPVNSHVLSCHYHQNNYVHSKKGGGAQYPQHKLPLATKGFLSPCYQHPLGEPTLSLVVLAPGGYFVHKQVQPHPNFFPTLCNQRYGCHALLWNLSLN